MRRQYEYYTLFLIQQCIVVVELTCSIEDYQKNFVWFV
ncbi:hypothetical protein NLO413_0674 [Candidatus Neoehrlichia lotoris str. RAC413]|uniref:Uncharacterized protein n=1 Tax=Candidatus Neoehrlichia procyonis str. RAC413 TaxID=1359163 RepID=A0A0F3NMK0_9RICK|nr:hypothetical protein NLO413_0674 [Candidatus Neoehrlichia lotoris str. RAC413]